MRAVNLIPGGQGGGSSSLTGRSGGAALMLLGLIAGLAVLAVLYGLSGRQIAKQHDELARIETQTSELKARTGRLTPYTSFVKMAEQRTKTVAQLVQARFDWSHMLRELGRVLPSGASLSTLSGTVGSGPVGASSTVTPTTASAGGAPTSSTPPGSTPSIALTGCATSQSAVAQTLQRLKLVDGVQEARLVSSTKSAKSSGGGSNSGGGCGEGQATFSMTVTFISLPATPIPNVTPTTAPASATTGARAHAEQVSGNAKGGSR
jgi:Tfp pilus assembly protein PilN